MLDRSLDKSSGDVRTHWTSASPLPPPSAAVTVPPGSLLRSRPTVCDSTARVTPICCLGRIVRNTTVELAASEIAPIGPVRPLDTTLDAPPRAPRQLAKGGPTDRCPEARPTRALLSPGPSGPDPGLGRARGCRLSLTGPVPPRPLSASRRWGARALHLPAGRPPGIACRPRRPRRTPLPCAEPAPASASRPPPHASPPGRGRPSAPGTTRPPPAASPDAGRQSRATSAPGADPAC